MHRFEHRVSSYCVLSPPYRYEPKDNSSTPSPLFRLVTNGFIGIVGLFCGVRAHFNRSRSEGRAALLHRLRHRIYRIVITFYEGWVREKEQLHAGGNHRIVRHHRAGLGICHLHCASGVNTSRLTTRRYPFVDFSEGTLNISAPLPAAAIFTPFSSSSPLASTELFR